MYLISVHPTLQPSANLIASAQYLVCASEFGFNFATTTGVLDNLSEGVSLTEVIRRFYNQTARIKQKTQFVLPDDV